jgi:putative endonuclease
MAHKLRNMRDAISRTIGMDGEKKARLYLEAKGYACISENIRIAGVEIDLLMRFKENIVIVEVKSLQAKDGDPSQSITSSKMRRLIRAAKALEQKYPDQHIQLDVVLVNGSSVINHLPDLEIS